VFSSAVERLPKFDIVVTLPDVVLETRKSRSVLPRQVPLTDAVENISYCSTIVHSMLDRNIEKVGKYLNDAVVLPYRKQLMPWYDRVMKAATGAGAIGFSVSGAGPAVFAICIENARKVAAEMEKAFKAAGFKSQSIITKPGKGAEVLTVK
ncbi:MAG: homoserine kinase, partial [Candidatus Thermoplasmatota archaeon]|nr:homoserine kinase [Candidatus Thermoplasmatota archaeon]